MAFWALLFSQYDRPDERDYLVRLFTGIEAHRQNGYAASCDELMAQRIERAAQNLRVQNNAQDAQRAAAVNAVAQRTAQQQAQGAQLLAQQQAQLALLQRAKAAQITQLKQSKKQLEEWTARLQAQNAEWAAQFQALQAQMLAAAQANATALRTWTGDAT